VFSELREELAKVDFVEVISRARENIMERVAESAEEKAREFGIDIVDVRVKRADLPVEVEQSVYLRMQAERQRESSLFRAEGEEQAAILRAKADRERTVILAEGYEESQRLRGEGEALAIKIYAAALEQDPSHRSSAQRARSRRPSCALRRTGSGRSSWPRATPRPSACVARVRPWPSRSTPQPWSKTRSSTPSLAVLKPIRSP
jgi:hypothetical protein